MIGRSKRILAVAAVIVVTSVVSASFAALLGIMPGYPLLTYDSNGTLTYNGTSKALDIVASPIAIRFTPVSPPRLVTPTGSPASEVLKIGIVLDSAGAVISGVPGDDLVIEGQVDQNGDTIPDYTGILLTGEIVAFGFEDSGPATDQYDFRFAVTGGALASFYTGMDIGVTTVSESSGFANDFNVNFVGGAKGSVGPIEKINRPPVCNANGPYAAECGGASTSIVLDGSQSTDQDGNQLSYEWSTSCAGATFDNPTSATPTLTIPTAGTCNLSCEVTLHVSDGIAPPQECVALVTISDTNAPSITCPADANIQCNTDTSPAATGTATAIDECDPNATVSYSDDEVPGACPQAKTIKRTWTASDTCGNTATCLQTINVSDTTPPIIVQCPPYIQVSCEQGTDPSVTGRPMAQDNCDPAPTADYSDVVNNGQCPVASIVTRTWTVSDACGNTATCVQTIKVRDTRRPVLTCPPDKTIQCTESKHPSNTGYATAVDGCDSSPHVTYCDEVCGSCPKVIRRTWRATDDCGNCATCVQTITVVDTQAPVITCPQDVTRSCGQSTDPCQTGRATADDNCDSCPSVTYCDTRVGCCPGNVTITRVWTARDRCGNRSTCTQIIRLTSPATCPNSPGYWKNHRERWPEDMLELGGRMYNSNELMNLLRGRNPNGSQCGSDASTTLARVLIAAKFSILNGSSPQSYADEIADADNFLRYYPPGSDPRGNNRRTALSLNDDLDTYVNSRPNGCRDDDDNNCGGGGYGGGGGGGGGNGCH